MTRDADLARRLDNLIRLGTIAAVDHARALCRVRSGGLLTDWLPWAERRAGTTRTWNPPTVGEQVLLLCPSGEPGAGIVLTGIYTEAHDQPSASADEHVTHYPDGARIAYNHASGALSVTGIKTALVEASESATLTGMKTVLVEASDDVTVTGAKTATVQASDAVTVDCPATTITGDVEIDGALVVKNGLTYMNGMVGFGPAGGGPGAVLQGDFIHTNGILSSNEVVLHTHKHTNVTTGVDLTGLPQQ